MDYLGYSLGRREEPLVDDEADTEVAPEKEASVFEHNPASPYEIVAAALEEAGDDEGLEEYSDIPFIGAQRTSFRDDAELLYAKLSGTVDGDGLEEYPDEAIIGAGHEESDQIADEYRDLLKEFSSPDELEDRQLRSTNIPKVQVQDEYQAMLDMVFAEAIEPEGPEDDIALDAGEAQPQIQEPCYTCWTPILDIGLSARTVTALSLLSATTVRGLVRKYDSLIQVPGAGMETLNEVRAALEKHSVEVPTDYDDDLIDYLTNISGSREYYFDALGNLTHISNPILLKDFTPLDNDARKELADSKLPIEMLGIPIRLINALHNAGYTTVGELSKLTRNEVLSLKGIGEGTVFQLEEILGKMDAYTLETAATIANIRQNQQPTYDALQGDETPIENLGLPNRLSNALHHQGYRTLGEISGLTDEQILSFRGLGALSVEQFHDAMNRLMVAHGADLQPAVHPDDACTVEGELPDTRQQASEQQGQGAPEEDRSGVPEDARKGASQALAVCKSRRYPVFDESFLAIMPFDALGSIGNGHTADEYEDAIIASLENSEGLLLACMRLLDDKIDTSQHAGAGMKFIDRIDLPDDPVWAEAARQLSDSSAFCSYDPEHHSIAITHPSILDWIDSSIKDQKTRTILKMYLEGSTLEACGQEVGLTRERVRQIVLKRLPDIPSVEENRYRYFFETYMTSKAEFLTVTGQPESTYIYLHSTATSKRKDKRALAAALSDERVPEHIRDGIRRFLDKDFVYEDGYRIHIDRVSIINHIAIRHASSHLIKVQRLKELYDQFLEDHGLSQTKQLPFGSMHNFEAYIDRCEMILKLPHTAEGRYGGSIRYYDASVMDFEPLIDLVFFGELEDVECSAAMLMHLDGFPEVLEDLDIRNEYELHYVLSRYCPNLGGVSFGRSPIIVFGKGNRNDQVLELIKELSPITASDLADAYSERYGVDSPTFKGSYLAGFDIYLKNGKYVYNSQGLDDAQSAFIAEQLGGSERGYISTALLKARFAARFPDSSTSLINGESVSAFGFHPSAGLLVRDGVDERELFGSLLDSKQRFSIDDEGFGKDVFDNPSFRAELAMRARACKLVEFEKNSFLSSRILSSIDIDIDETDLKDYVDCAIEFMAADRPYTVQRLRSEGFSHKVDVLRDEFGLEDFFFASLLATGTVGGRLKMTTIGEATVFCKTFYGYSAPVLVEQIIGEDGAMEIDDLIYLLEDDYDIHESATVLRSIVKRSDLYFNETLDMVFGSEETYRRKAREWIS